MARATGVCPFRMYRTGIVMDTKSTAFYRGYLPERLAAKIPSRL
jgi:hypothetical protein